SVVVPTVPRFESQHRRFTGTPRGRITAWLRPALVKRARLEVAPRWQFEAINGVADRKAFDRPDRHHMPGQPASVGTHAWPPIADWNSQLISEETASAEILVVLGDLWE